MRLEDWIGAMMVKQLARTNSIPNPTMRDVLDAHARQIKMAEFLVWRGRGMSGNLAETTHMSPEVWLMVFCPSDLVR